MTYSLALKLKENGLMPLLTDYAEYYLADDIIVHRKDILGVAKHANGDNVAMNNWVYKPTLEVLLSAITGVPFAVEKLATQDVIYRAYNVDDTQVSFTAPEADEAVALLWLEFYGK